MTFLLIPALFSCSARSGSVHELSYKKLLERNTRDGKVYDTFETKLIAHATIKDTPFVMAQIDKQAKELLYNNDKVSVLKLKATRENENSINFFLALYTPDDRFADFSKSKGLWKFYIQSGNSEPVAADMVKQISKPDRPEYEVLYPYVTPWMLCYKVSFRRSDLVSGTGSNRVESPIYLIIAGQLGTLKLQFITQDSHL